LKKHNGCYQNREADNKISRTGAMNLITTKVVIEKIDQMLLMGIEKT